MQKTRRRSMEERKPGVSGKNIIGAKLKILRKSHNPPLTLDEFAELLNRNANLEITKLMLSQIETNRRPVYDYEIKDFAKILGVSLSDLF